MPTPPSRARLSAEPLEDRTVPTAASFDPTRVLVTVTAATPQAAALAALPSATPVGPGLYRVGLASELSVAAAVDQLGKVPGLAAQPDYLAAPATVPNDPSYQSQWAYSTISAPAAWDAATGTGQTIVAVVDSGIDYRHPDLAANLWRNPREVAGNQIDDDQNGFVDDVFGADFANNDGDPFDDVGHGTGVAGIIGAAGNNGVGGTGVAWRTRIMALKFMGSAAGGYTSDAVRAIDYAIANGAKVINLSWGNGNYDAAVSAAIGRARAAGVLVVAAAGNNGSDNDAAGFYPANAVQQYDNVLSVAATDSSDRLASFSNFGRTTALVAAPGVSILTTQPNNRYAALSGTSVATPFIAGAAALTWDANPTWTYRQVMGKLGWSVDTLASLTGRVATNGRVNLGRMVLPPPAVSSPPVVPPPASPPITGDTTGPRVISAAFAGTAANTFDRVRVTFSEPVNPATVSGATVSVSGPGGLLRFSAAVPVAGTNNTAFTLLLSKRETTPGTYVVWFSPNVRDAAGNAAEAYTATATIAGAVAPPPPTATATNRLTYTAAGLPKAIADRRTTRIDFAVTDDVRVGDLNVEIDLTHARTADLSIRVVAPDGRAVTLFNRRAGANLSGVVFDDAGTFKPEQALSLFNGTSARGVWSVQVFDLADGATGTVNRVALSIAHTGDRSVVGSAFVGLQASNFRRGGSSEARKTLTRRTSSRASA